jgi:hypothetical protein
MRDPTASWHKRKALVAHAVSLYEAALAQLEREHGTNALALAPVVERLAAATREHSGGESALVHYRRLVEILSLAHGADDASLVVPILQMARIELERLNFASAKQLYERALTLHALGAEVPRSATYGDGVTSVLSRLGWCAERLGLVADAVSAYERVLSRDRQVAAPTDPALDQLFPEVRARYLSDADTPEAVDALLGLAGIVWERGDRAQGTQLAERALRAWYATSGLDNWLHVRRLELRDIAKRANVEVLGIVGPPRPGHIERLVEAWKAEREAQKCVP